MAVLSNEIIERFSPKTLIFKVGYINISVCFP
ncbi:hypothetical protein PanWU01x14_266450 [Parasponia andersonii]|uniref:Uncharacterized protein n=1 Tax=Parasponia andersonii TaxID=3476 RepID=A0A2P5B6Q7_PARAD|nr:hypothetical protein PanWU01x14_266450 [Parasponia andersonii]